MIKLSIASLLMLLGLSSASGEPQPRNPMPPLATSPATATSMLFDFAKLEKMHGWVVVNDGVMGGKSRGGFKLEPDFMVFSGITNTDGGGFSSIRGKLPQGTDLSDADGLLIRLRTDGERSFKVDLRQSSPERTRALSFRAPVQAAATTDWQEVRVPFKAFAASWRGRAVPGASLNKGAATQLGLYIFDGKDGAFRLEVESISTYQGNN